MYKMQMPQSHQPVSRYFGTVNLVATEVETVAVEVVAHLAAFVMLHILQNFLQLVQEM